MDEMSKSEMRAARRAAVAAGRAWTAVQEDGTLQQVKVRTKKEESAHWDRMERWARRNEERNT